MRNSYYTMPSYLDEERLYPCPICKQDFNPGMVAEADQDGLYYVPKHEVCGACEERMAEVGS